MLQFVNSFLLLLTIHRQNITRIFLSKLNCSANLQYYDVVKKKSNGMPGKFFGYCNSSKTKCFVLWNAPRGNKGTAPRGNNECSPGTRCDNYINKCKLQKNKQFRADADCTHSTERNQRIFSANKEDTEHVKTDGDRNKRTAPRGINECCPGTRCDTYINKYKLEKNKQFRVDADCTHSTEHNQRIFSANKEDTEHVKTDGDGDKEQYHLSNLLEKIQAGDMIYDRSETEPQCAKWFVITQASHYRDDCKDCNEHTERKDENGKIIKDPACVALTPALITSAGITNTPDPNQKSECWYIDIAQEHKKVSNIFEAGYTVMCRDNYHVCLISCRKYKKKIRALYCRMRMPRRPMEHTRISQLCVPKKHPEAMISTTIASAIGANGDTCISRPQLEIQQNKAQDDYWQDGNKDVLAAPDNRALVVDLARLTGERAMHDKIRAQVVPNIFARILAMLPDTTPQETIQTTFESRPFGFTYTPSEDNCSVILKRVKKQSAAAKAGLTEGMRLISVNGVNVADMKAELVRDILRNIDSVKTVLKFQLAAPVTQLPGMFHVKHPSVLVAAGMVGHIESFLGHTHEYEDPRMAESNAVLAALLKCNTNVQPVGSLSSAMSVLQYLSGYLSKNPVELCNFVTCIITARRHCKRYKSTAEDEGSTSRNAKFLGQKVPNVCI